MTLVDAEARRAIRESLEETLVVEAAAGTGKTTELVQRMVALLASGVGRLSRLAAVTFTEKAAGEMKLRLRTEIERRRTVTDVTDPMRARLDAALEELEAAHLGTIHGFCADVLRDHPIEAGIDPMFTLLDDGGRDRVYAGAFEQWFQRVLGAPPEGVRRLLRRRATAREGIGARETLWRAGLERIDQRDHAHPWHREPFDREPALDAVFTALEGLGALAAQARDPEDWLAKGFTTIQTVVNAVREAERVSPRDYDALEDAFQTLRGDRCWTWGGRGARPYGAGLPREELARRREGVKARLDEVVNRADADLAACLHDDLGDLVIAYERAKAHEGALDFLDLLVRTRDLLRGRREVRHALQARFAHLLVDEFQDTDPLQAEILLVLAADDPDETDWRTARPIPGKLFVVGDPKQSIYRFRRADVSLYESVKRRLVEAGGRELHLVTSFRMVPSLQRAINAAFAPAMQGSPDGSQAHYVALEPVRHDVPDRPSLIALPVPSPYGDYGKITNYAIDRSLPDAVGAFVAWLLRESGWHVSERGAGSVPVQARHVCLLSRRFIGAKGRDVTRPYVAALEARGVEHVLVGGRSFHHREEVIALRNALAAIEWPDDELSVFATLHGPFLALGDDALLAFRATHGRLDPLRPVDEAKLDDLTRPVADALSLLKRLHRGRNRRPLADTVSSLLDAVRAHAGVAMWHGGAQALGNLLRVVDLARRFEREGTRSFRAFVEQLDVEAERGTVSEAPVLEERTDGVRIMTVHRAKGLEFPVVILIDPTCPATHRVPSRYTDSVRGLSAAPIGGCVPYELATHGAEVLRHDDEESVRLTYVAATRARDLLVVPTVGDGRIDGWLGVLDPVVLPDRDSRDRGDPAEGCPAFGTDTVAHRPSELSHLEGSAVRPGAHRPAVGAHTVVWWDPSVLRLEVAPAIGLRQERVLMEDTAGVAAQVTLDHATWQTARTRLLDVARRPAIALATATTLVDPDRPYAGTDLVVETTRAARGQRPSGKRLGSLIHAALAQVPLDADPGAITATVEQLARAMGANGDERRAAVDSVSCALDHPRWREVLAATEVRRETPVQVRVDDGTWIEGVLDLAYRVVRDGVPQWTVIDFKSDADVRTLVTTYGAQLATYVRAVAAATGESACGVFLAV